MILDLGGRRVRVRRPVAQLLRDAAARRAGSSSAHRDLSLVLTRAIESGSLVALQRAEMRTLLELLEGQEIPPGSEMTQLLELTRSIVAG